MKLLRRKVFASLLYIKVDRPLPWWPVNLSWYARLDSNQRPCESESHALSICATGAYLTIYIVFCPCGNNRSCLHTGLPYYSRKISICKEKFLQLGQKSQCDAPGRWTGGRGKRVRRFKLLPSGPCGAGWLPGSFSAQSNKKPRPHSVDCRFVIFRGVGYRSLLTVSRSPKIMSSISTPVKGPFMFAITSFLYLIASLL